MRSPLPSVISTPPPPWNARAPPAYLERRRLPSLRRGQGGGKQRLYGKSGTITRFSAPKSAATWLNGRNGPGVNAGFYLASAYPSDIHGFLLQGSTFTVVNHPNAANTWLFDVNPLGGAVGSFSAGQSVTKGFRLLNGSYTTIAYPNPQVTNALAINAND